jgi:hypothetical protein
MTRVHVFEKVGQKAYYLFQKATAYGIDEAFERELRHRGAEYLATYAAGRQTGDHVEEVRLEALGVEDRTRFSIVRDDIYVRFLASEAGREMDKFGRKGTWVPRGSKIYYDGVAKDHVKVFDAYFCRRGEGRFLKDALHRGLYDFLCPNLSYVIVDADGVLRGYAIRGGRPLTPYEFERYVGKALRDVICRLTACTGLYFYDLAFHNVILDGDRLSLIDLESVLPVEWFGKGIDFSLRHLSDIDVGWPVQTKWHSPRWYRDFLVDAMIRPVARGARDHA